MNATHDGDPSAPSQPESVAVPDNRSLVPQPEERTAQQGWVARLLARLGLKGASGDLRADLHEALADASDSDFSPEERAMLQNILRLRERRVVDVMVPRGDVEAVPLDITLGALLRIFQECGHSRLPVYGETLDDPRGMVLIKDLLLHMTRIAAQPPKPPKGPKGGRRRAKADDPLRMEAIDLDAPLEALDLTRTVLFVPPSMLATDLMARMQATRTQMALVIDEYGGTDGLVSLEDIVEEVVGEIEDEHDDEDEADEKIIAQEPGVWLVDPRTELDRIRDVVGLAFDPGDRAEDIDTIGGLVFALAGHVPVRGEVVTAMPGFEFRVQDADPRRIRRLLLVQKSVRDASRERRKRAGQAGHAGQGGQAGQAAQTTAGATGAPPRIEETSERKTG